MNEVQENTLPKKHSRIWLWLILLIFFLPGVLLTVVSYLVFAPWQEVPLSIPSAVDMMTQYKLIQRLGKSFDFRNNKFPQKDVLELSPQEINSLFTFAGNIKPKDSPYPLRYYRLHFTEKGEFSLTFPVKTDIEKIWGGAIYLKAVFAVSKAPGEEIKINLRSCRVTSLPLSVSMAQKLVDELMAEAQVQDQLKQLDDVIQSISFENGKLKVEYSPRKLVEQGFRF